MDGLGELEKKLEEAISLVKSFGPEDRVQGGIIWNAFSAQMQAIINSTIDTSDTIDEPSLSDADESKDVEECGGMSNAILSEGNEGIHNSSGKVAGRELCTPKEISGGDNTLSAHQNEPSISSEMDEETNATLDNSGADDTSQSTMESLSTSEVKDTKDSEEVERLPNDTPSKLHCDICSESVENETELKKHLKSSHKKSFTCNECDASFSKKGNLNVHKRKHTGDRPFPCPKCTNRFTTSGNLRRHLLSHQGLKPYSCSTCQARFTEKRNLLIHVRTHTGEKPYECPVCNKKFAHSSVLAQHKSIHKNLKPHLCHQCGKSFTQKSQLKVHEKRHSGVKSHVCQFCDSSFTTRSDLLRHQKTHTGEKPFTCSHCGKSFARSYTFKEHLNTKHPVEPKSN